MDKKKQGQLIIGAAALFGGFLLWKKFGAKPKSTTEKPPDTTSTTKTTNTTTSTVASGNLSSGYSTYQKKVMTIQGVLGVAMDGVAGPQTNGALAKKLPNAYATLGALSSSNVDAYLAALGVQKAQETIAVQNATLAKQVQGIIAAKGVVQMLSNFTAKELIYNNATNTYVATGNTRLFTKGYKFTNWEKRNRGDKTVLMSWPDNLSRWEFPPSVLIVTAY